jgi:hypothetical protein
MNESDAFAMLKAKRDAASANQADADADPDDGASQPPADEQGSQDGEPEGDGAADVPADGGEQDDEGAGDADEPIFTVKVNGEARQVPLSELTQTYSSAKHLESKQHEILAREREVTTLKQQVGGLANQYQQQLGHLSQMMRPNLPDQNQLTALLHAATVETDPAKRAEANTRYLQGKEAIDRYNAVLGEQRRVQVQQDQQAKADRDAFEAQQADLLRKASPDFANPQYVQKAVGYLKSQGFEDTDIADLGDHRAWLIVDKARKWDERNQNIGKGVRKAAKEAKVLSPSGEAPKQDPNAVQKLAAREAFEKNPNVKNALARLKAAKQQPLRG